MENIILIFLFIITIGSACIVAFSRHIVYSAFALMGTFLGVAGCFVLLQADFLGLVQVVVYAGGILVLTIFAVMLTAKIEKNKISNPVINFKIVVPVILCVVFLLLYVVMKGVWAQSLIPLAGESQVSQIGDALLSKYLLPFELVSVVLLIAMIAAAIITRRHVR